MSSETDRPLEGAPASRRVRVTANANDDDAGVVTGGAMSACNNKVHTPEFGARVFLAARGPLHRRVGNEKTPTLRAERDTAGHGDDGGDRAEREKVT